MNFREPKLQYVFADKDKAAAFVTALKHSDVRLQGRVTKRVALPEYKHGGSPGTSVFFQGLGLPDTSGAAHLAKSMGGRRWGTRK